ncbi:GNAT family N-acetyltransferase [Neorhizobium sp. NCHU2750]|uniref:GNAT family N-acetyltransferase n=1 Tax=Neorhizobium sp. NCHU2750 TaxID=1825976 RepID=UPI000E76CDB7|nr:GCN5 family acetyltransferase [Neorhizobium sp. NCHU2750]
MQTDNPALPFGYSPVPAGKLANMVTCLDMSARPPARPQPPSNGLSVERWPSPTVEDYRDLYRRVGEDWMWVSRLVMPDEKLKAIITDPLVEIYVLTDGARRLGLLELDFRQQGECELGYFGVVPEAIGNGSGRILMNAALDHAWAKPITRFWVHTCSFDHPAALAFYQRSGFRPYAFMVEVCDDPRLDGRMPKSAAPHVPLIEL